MENQESQLKQQLRFAIEVDKMKNILRRTVLMDESRRETDAEHSWHFAMIAMLFFEYAGEGVNQERVLKMALVHDLVEIYAGDTFAFDEHANVNKDMRERQSADKLFTQLPASQGMELRSLWEEFDAMETPDARYAAAIDRLQPFLSNYVTKGHTWLLGHVTSDKVYKRLEPVRTDIPALWPIVEGMIQESIEKGYLAP